MTWLHLLNDCAEINKMLNVPIQKLSTLHSPLSRAPAPHDGADHSRVKQVLFQISGIGGRQCVPEGLYSSAAYAAHRWEIEVKFLLINFLH